MAHGSENADWRRGLFPLRGAVSVPSAPVDEAGRVPLGVTRAGHGPTGAVRRAGQDTTARSSPLPLSPSAMLETSAFTTHLVPQPPPSPDFERQDPAQLRAPAAPSDRDKGTDPGCSARPLRDSSLLFTRTKLQMTTCKVLPAPTVLSGHICPFSCGWQIANVATTVQIPLRLLTPHVAP